jgi:hypothetical protein
LFSRWLLIRRESAAVEDDREHLFPARIPGALLLRRDIVLVGLDHGLPTSAVHDPNRGTILMKYSDAQIVMVGDTVSLWNGCFGVVVCSIDTNEYTSSYRKEDWGHLKSGVMIKTEKAGLIHYIEPDEDLQLFHRADPKG